MKDQLHGALLVATLFIASCSLPPGERTESPVATFRGHSHAQDAEAIYRTIFNRENFRLPREQTDYKIDYAMRMGRIPRLDEPAGMPSDVFLLEGKMNQVLDKMREGGPAEAANLLSKLTNEFGLTWWLVEGSRDLDPKSKAIVRDALRNPASKKSTYCQPALIKARRIQSGNWHP